MFPGHLRIKIKLISLLFTCIAMAKTGGSGRKALQNVVLFGATGQTGQAFVELLCGGERAQNYLNHDSAVFKDAEGSNEDPEHRTLTAVTRRDFDWGLNDTNPKPFGNFRLRLEKIDFENMPTTLGPVLKELTTNSSIDVAFCAHGTTRSSAGSAENFIWIDKEYTLEMARQCKAAGVKHFSLLSSAMADPKSMLLYPRTKGQIIAEIKAMGFERFSVFKPALLVTQKREDARIGESFAQSLNPILSWVGRTTGIKSLEGIKVEDLAAAMISNAMAPSNVSYQEFETAPHIIALQPS